MAIAEVALQPATEPSYTLGERMAKSRHDVGLDQLTMAKALGVSRPLVSKWERNKSIPNVEQAKAWAAATAVSFGWLCGVRSERFASIDGDDDGRLFDDDLNPRLPSRLALAR